MISGVNNTSAALNQSAKSSGTDAQSMQDQFLTLLVAQLQNQDPTNPMDNAQMTSQMAQISTVSGIEKLNDTVQSVTSQFASMQMLQGATMIGHTVLSEGNALNLTDKGQGSAAFDLEGSAANVTVTITTAGGQLVDTMELGSAAAGRNYFTWDGSNYNGDTSNLRFKVSASNGDAAVKATTLSPNAVVATSIANGSLMLELANGQSINYNSVKAVF
ncbi:flagellar hook assembly protein FlgD [Comamonas kerstersii]|jgi:flagellar basal-body rod modification protein FlgD|uniref:Basal-body rod modification protein FlgD n=1 Tax=Comamonas kerstersii TaxID=225992 RepID=A0A0W7Z546_9BURK|nr:flagellar hook assembly protein FlgD [Comamonas kerstersii]AQZ97612.1 flagellar biosynthesis protein FlgD [Comamonas kerstersii]KUF42455.1 flagellar biosynthesis protein FlgD [Comamonas kerstersii]OOH88753.1 flagellar biosynthesis protein FlgD [Comamonas kerstersii]OOH95041.1 flagellar biosynthesis protein FlgD [Comamonas kerstersii]HBW63010.1 flagellar hook assembly protein FlgD [Comamonas kerstersii]